MRNCNGNRRSLPFSSMKRYAFFLVLSVLMLAACKPQQNEHDGVDHDKDMMTFAQLMQSGMNQICTFHTMTAVGQETFGTVYVETSESNLRADITTTSPAQMRYDVHAIRIGNTSHVWSALDEGHGLMMELGGGDTSFFGKEATEGENKIGIEESQPVHFECEPWAADRAMFDLPVDVTFLEPGAMPEEKNMYENNGNEARCQACNLLSDPVEQEECRIAEGC